MKTIALVDFSLDGHHLSFVRTFTKILLEQGNQVFCVVPDVELISNWINVEAPSKKSNFIGCNYAFQSKNQKGWGRFNAVINTLKRWQYDVALLHKLEVEHNKKIDLVFYAWMDSYLSRYIHPAIHRFVFPYKWSGLYFHPYHLRLEKEYLSKKANFRDYDSVFLSPNCLGVAVHDLGVLEGFSYRLGKPVIHFPETADDTAPDFELTLYKEIKEKAKGRVVVGMIGCEKHKGTLTMMRMARMADAGQYYFAFLGILPEATYSSDEWKELQYFINSKPENCLFHFQSIPEGAAYNAVFCAIDIPFLVYDNFISSSNRLTKAAIFQKLVLASNNYCVGEDVEKFKLGIGVSPQDPNAALAALKELRIKLIENKLPFQEWEAYRQLNSNKKLFDRFKEITLIIN